MGETLGFALRQKKEMKAEVNEKEESKKMKRNKTGAMFMVSVLALAGIGISYAGFTDAIYVYGTVDTATVDIDWIGWYSGTWVYKIWGFPVDPQLPADWTEPFLYDLDNEILIYRGFTKDQPLESDVLAWATANEGTAELVAYAEAGEGGTGMSLPDTTAVVSDVDMEYDNLFPCIDFCADFIFHYGGSIPAKVNVAEIFPILYSVMYPDSEELAELWAIYQGNPDAGFGMWVEAYRAEPLFDDNDDTPEDYAHILDWEIGEAVDVGTQLHYCDYVMVKLCIHLPQDNYWQGLNGAFGGKIGVIQWNDQCQ